MKNLIILIQLLISITGYSQSVEFPIDEAGKYLFTDVVDLKGLTKDQLFENGLKFMKKIKVLHSKSKFLNASKENYKIFNRGSFYVYRIGSVKKAIAGAVEYDVTLEFKEDKYRYTITNFLFNEYKKNRYGKYEPITGKYKPLEMDASSINKKEWEKQKEVVYQKTEELVANLYGEMIYAEEKKKKNAKKEDNW